MCEALDAYCKTVPSPFTFLPVCAPFTRPTATREHPGGLRVRGYGLFRLLEESSEVLKMMNGA